MLTFRLNDTIVFLQLQLMSLYELLNLFPRWPLVFRSFLRPSSVARDVVTPALGLGIVRHIGIDDNFRPPDSERSALDSIHQNHLGREGLRWNDGQLMTCYTKKQRGILLRMFCKF